MPNFRPRISILTALLLMTILGMAIVIVRQWREIGPLRTEVAARRAEMGQLFIADPNKAHAIGVDWNQEGVWRWRLFLPEKRNSNWTIRTYCGRQPAFNGYNLKKWLAGPRSGKSREWSSTGGVIYGREFTEEIKLGKDEKSWYLQEKGGSKERIPESYNAWLDNPKLQFPISMVLSSEQTIYEPGEPIVLLCVQQSNDSRAGGADGDTILVWIEEHP